jgi:PmbA protein
VTTSGRSELVHAAQAVLRRALHHGASQASVIGDEVQSVDFEWRDGRLEKVRQAQSSIVTVRLFVEGRYSVHQSSDLRENALEAMICQAVDLTKHLSEDPHRGLPEPELCMPPLRMDVELVDFSWSSVAQADRIGAVEALESASRTVPGAPEIATVTTGWSDSFGHRVMVDSNGFHGETEGTTFWLGSTVTVRGEGLKRPRGWYWVGARHLEDLPAVEQVGAEATKRAMDRVNTKQVKTGRYQVVVENRSMGRLIGSLFGALSGAAIQQESSFLCGKIGERVASSLLRVDEAPLVRRGLGTRLFDSEGMTARRFPVLEQGVLRSYYLDTYYARKLGMTPTTGGSANLRFSRGSRDLEAMVSDLDEGILVTGFLGGNSNSTTGDFSFGIMGLYIKDGERKFPVAEVNMAGNHLAFWNKLVEVGNDPYPYSSRYCPSMAFEGVQVTGL